jgi:hypothetical protein
MNVTTVRFRDVRQQPYYDATHPESDRMHRCSLSRAELQARLIGQPVAILLPPTVPIPSRECGVERVWQLPDEEVVRLTGTPPRDGCHVFVCEHQVEID